MQTHVSLLLQKCGPANLTLYLHMLNQVLHYNPSGNTSLFFVELALTYSDFFNFLQVFPEYFLLSFVHYLQLFRPEALVCMTGVPHLHVSLSWTPVRIWWVVNGADLTLEEVTPVCDVH
jgi:hypothetical protein